MNIWFRVTQGENAHIKELSVGNLFINQPNMLYGDLKTKWAANSSSKTLRPQMFIHVCQKNNSWELLKHFRKRSHCTHYVLMTVRELTQPTVMPLCLKMSSMFPPKAFSPCVGGRWQMVTIIFLSQKASGINTGHHVVKIWHLCCILSVKICSGSGKVWFCRRCDRLLWAESAGWKSLGRGSALDAS